MDAGSMNMSSSAAAALGNGAIESARMSPAATDKARAEVSPGFASWLIPHRIGIAV
jgi:hypothetical protein